MEQQAPRPDVAIATGDTPITGPAWHVHFCTDPLPCAEAEAASLLGAKAVSLWRLFRAGLPMPPAFTVTTHACRQFHALSRQWPDGLWPQVRAAVAQLEESTGRTFGAGPRPLTLAIRSGAAESMPGLMATILHCGISPALARQMDDESTWQAFSEFLRGYAAIRLPGIHMHDPQGAVEAETARSRCERWLTQIEQSPYGSLPADPDVLLRETIAAVFDSWETPAARRFRELRGWTSAMGTAVTVQAMFDSEVAGVAFSRDPYHADETDLVIEAVAGLGQPLVAGQVTPARWRVERATQAVRDAPVWRPASDRDSACSPLADFEQRGLQPVCHAALVIEELFQAPVDVEFGYAAGELVFFQARPIARESASLSTEQARQSQRARLLSWAKQGRKLWVRHNLSETLPAPTPLTWDLWREFMSGRGGYGRMYRRLGYRPSTRVGRDGFLELIAGRIYADPKRLTEMFCGGYPLAFDPAALRADPAVLNAAPTHLDLEQLDPWFLLRWPLVAFTVARSGIRGRRLTQNAASYFDRHVAPRIYEVVRRERQIDLSRLSLSELIDVFDRRRRLVFDEIAPETLLPGTLGAAAWTALAQRLTVLLGEADGRALAGELLSRIDDPVTHRQREMLEQLAQGATTIDAFLREFGHRGPGEMELSLSRWREMPDAVRAAARGMASTLAPPPTNQRTPADDRLRTELAQVGAGCFHRELSGLLHHATTLLPYREIGKHELLRCYELLREVLTELSRRLPLGNGIHFLTLDELHMLPTRQDFESAIAQRRQVQRAYRRLYVPAVLEVRGDLDEFGHPPREGTRGRILLGTSLSRGEAIGRASLFLERRPDFESASDRVVVASTIDPGAVPWLADAAALVVEQGGILSHVAVLARQLSIPAVVIDGITSTIEPGETIRVDADRGLVELLDRPA